MTSTRATKKRACPCRCVDIRSAIATCQRVTGCKVSFCGTLGKGSDDDGRDEIEEVVERHLMEDSVRKGGGKGRSGADDDGKDEKNDDDDDNDDDRDSDGRKGKKQLRSPFRAFQCCDDH